MPRPSPPKEPAPASPTISTKPRPLPSNPIRDRCIEALTFADLSCGRGDQRQRDAYEELEWRRCAASFNYWRTTYAWLKVKGGDAIPWTSPFPCQDQLGDLWQTGVSTIDIKTRQNGETSTGIHYCLWDCLFHDAVTWNYFGADEDAGKDALDRLAATIDRLPPWMVARAQKTPGQREGTSKRKRSQYQQSVTIITFGLSSIRVWTGSVRKSQGLAGKVFWDDAAKHEDKARKWQLMWPTINDPEPGHSGQIIIVFNGQGEEFCYHLWEKARDGEVNLVANFFDWKADPRRLEGAFDGEDGKTHYPWYDDAEKQYLIENPDADRYAFKAQFPSNVREAIYLHGNSRFGIAELNAIADVVRAERETAAALGEKWPVLGLLHWDGSDTPPKFEKHHTGRVRRYYEPVEGGRYIVAVDAAGGRQSSDYCVAMVGRVHDDGSVEQVCVYEAKVEPEDELVHNALALCTLYNKALLIPETGSSAHGQSFCNIAKLRYDYIYQAIRTSRYIDEEKLELGYATSSATRGPLIDRLASSLGRRNAEDTAWDREPTFHVHDERTLDEMNRMEIDPVTNRVEAPKGSNDDLVIAAALLLVGSEWMASPERATSRIFLPTEW